MEKEKFEELWQIMKRLRRECPWDGEQTHESIKTATLEEAYEVLEAIDNKNWQELKSELGDLLFHVVFHSAIAEENNEFTLNEVMDEISQKLIRRHPHVFGNVKAETKEDIERNWENIKLQQEGKKSVVDGIPKHLPALLRSFRLQEKASKVGFDWKRKEDAWKKVEEEFAEFKEAESNSDFNHMEEEFGDLLFVLVNYARFLKINPENAMRRVNEKFIYRFQFIENKLAELGKTVSDSNLEEMDKFWNEAKMNRKG